jgi:hypothetical protein
MGRFTPWTMKSYHGRWPFSMVRLHGPTSMIRLLDKSIYKALGLLTRCKLNVDQEEWPCTKNECTLFFCNIYLERAVWKKIKFDHSFYFSCSYHFFPKKIHKKFIITSFLCYGTCLFLREHLFCLSHRKFHWTMPGNNVNLKGCLLGTSNSMVTLKFFPWCSPKWSWDKFNNQSQILQGLRTSSWSMVQTTPIHVAFVNGFPNLMCYPKSTSKGHDLRNSIIFSDLQPV